MATKLTGTKWDKFLIKFADNFSDDPLKLWSRNGLMAIFELKDPGTVIRARNITYTAKMIEEFEKQIPELLGKGLIRDNYSPHSSPAFVVINHAEQVRGKARMVIN